MAAGALGVKGKRALIPWKRPGFAGHDDPSGAMLTTMAADVLAVLS
jgi:hypothetical protein